MSVRRQALKYTAAAFAIAALIIVSSALYLNGSVTKTGQQGGTSSKLVIQLTDPPIVPSKTSSLNLSYSSIDLLVGEPASGGQQTTKTVTVNSGGTLDLLKLQNVSQTIALASLPNGTVIYSFTLTVTGISIDVNGTKSAVTLATGGSTLTVTLARPAAIQGTSIALLQLNPTVISTPSGYQMIPSAVGIVKSEGQGQQNQEQVGWQQRLTNEDQNQLERAQGNVTANLTSLSVSGNSTTITVQVQNMGNASVVLNAIGIHGNFSSLGLHCGASSEFQTHTSGSQNHANESRTHANESEGQDGTTSTTSSSSETECEFEHANEVVFVPVNATVSGTSCVSLKMQLANGNSAEGDHGLTLAKGQCVNLTFTGEISFGESHFVLVPSVSSGQVYGIHVIASEGANLELSCSLPITAHSCSATHSADQ